MIPSSIIIAVVAALVFVFLLSSAVRTFRKVGPNQALLVYGWVASGLSPAAAP